MAITVDWSTNVIFVPKADLTLIGGSVYELDVDSFRLELKAIEASEEGLPFLDTHEHNTSVLLSGVTYARIVSILAPYTIEFEDGNYSVSCIGANHNIADVKVVNSVSLIINNSAGLIVVSGGGALTPEESAQLAKLDYMEAGVWIDTELVSAGDGSQATPFNTLTAGIDYAESKGIRTLYINADITLDRSLKNFKVIGIGVPTIDCNGQDLTRSEFWHCSMEGSYAGIIIVQESNLLAGFRLNGFFEKSGISGNLVCVSGGFAFVKDCTSNIPITYVNISMNSGGTSSLIVSGFSGHLNITDCDHADDVVEVGMDTGSLKFDTTCVDGNMLASGMCGFVDLATTAGATVIDNTGDPKNINVQNKVLMNKTETDPVTGVMTVYEKDDVTVAFTCNIWENVAATTPYQGNAVNRRDRLS